MAILQRTMQDLQRGQAMAPVGMAVGAMRNQPGRRVQKNAVSFIWSSLNLCLQLGHEQGMYRLGYYRVAAMGPCAALGLLRNQTLDGLAD